MARPKKTMSKPTKQKVEDKPDLARVTESSAVVNTNRSALAAAKMQKRQTLQQMGNTKLLEEINAKLTIILEHIEKS